MIHKSCLSHRYAEKLCFFHAVLDFVLVSLQQTLPSARRVSAHWLQSMCVGAVGFKCLRPLISPSLAGNWVADSLGSPWASHFSPTFMPSHWLCGKNTLMLKKVRCYNYVPQNSKKNSHISSMSLNFSNLFLCFFGDLIAVEFLFFSLHFFQFTPRSIKWQ